VSATRGVLEVLVVDRLVFRAAPRVFMEEDRGALVGGNWPLIPPNDSSFL
jgi:hypothetical protein